MKYRIVQTPRGYIIQKKWLGLFWTHCSERYYWHWHEWPAYYYLMGSSRRFIYKSYDSAKKGLEMIKAFPMYYKGHKIFCGSFANGTHSFVDVSMTENWLSSTYYFGTENLDALKKLIDEYEENKAKEKIANKILKVYPD